jgi:hypothetical protein
LLRTGGPLNNSDLLALGDEIWTWRAVTQPLSGDDIPRIERPTDWVPDWSPDAVARRRQQLAAFEARHAALRQATRAWPIDQQVDYRLLGSALARVRWELDILKKWRRNPHFYVHQSLGAIFEALLQPPPFDATRTRQLTLRAESIPATLEAARVNLANTAVGPFANLAIDALQDIQPRLATVTSELRDLLDAAQVPRFEQAMEAAGRSLEDYTEWLRERRNELEVNTAIGRNTYIWFLRNVALVPLSPEQIVAGAQQELERSIAFETLERQRNRNIPPPTLPTSQADQIAREAAGEAMLRSFCEANDLLTFPHWLKRYRNLPMPAYLAPLRGVGVTDDLTSATRLDEDGTSYIPEPAPDLPYFYLAMARDPRSLIAHEGIHYYQLAQSWAHPDRLRRYFYDSGPNEGIGFYAEEMLLQAGLFDDSPHTREIIYSFMRLRAVRVGVDVRLAFGELTIDSAANELARRVPMDVVTAREEASFFASEPCQAITYQIGKLQIVALLADARRARGEAFDLRAFHDKLMLDGNVPVALQRWEMLGLDDELGVLDTAIG